jgi:hypothetical protein
MLHRKGEPTATAGLAAGSGCAMCRSEGLSESKYLCGVRLLRLTAASVATSRRSRRFGWRVSLVAARGFRAVVILHMCFFHVSPRLMRLVAGVGIQARKTMGYHDHDGCKFINRTCRPPINFCSTIWVPFEASALAETCSPSPLLRRPIDHLEAQSPYGPAFLMNSVTAP